MVNNPKSINPLIKIKQYSLNCAMKIQLSRDIVFYTKVFSNSFERHLFFCYTLLAKIKVMKSSSFNVSAVG